MSARPVTAAPRVDTRVALGSLVLLQLGAMCVVILASLPRVPAWHGRDLRIYYMASARLLAGALPYRDFPLEYPPLALFPFALPRLVVLGHPLAPLAYSAIFALENVLWSLLLTAVLARIAARLAPARGELSVALRCALLVLVAAPLAVWRFDLFPALLTALVLWGVLAARPAAAGVALGLAIAAKVYPVVLVPVFVAWYLASGAWRALARMAAGALAAIALCLLPFLILAPNSLMSLWDYHTQRGLQLESLPAGVLALVHVLNNDTLGMVLEHGALELVSPAAAAILPWLAPAAILALALVTALAWRRFRAERSASGAVAGATLARALLAALLAFIVTSRVFSPQFVIWLLPFAALLRPRAWFAMLAIGILTTALYPFAYAHLVALEPAAVLLLDTRNALVLALAVALAIGPQVQRAT